MDFRRSAKGGGIKEFVDFLINWKTAVYLMYHPRNHVTHFTSCHNVLWFFKSYTNGFPDDKEAKHTVGE